MLCGGAGTDPSARQRVLVSDRREGPGRARGIRGALRGVRLVGGKADRREGADTTRRWKRDEALAPARGTARIRNVCEAATAAGIGRSTGSIHRIQTAGQAPPARSYPRRARGRGPDTGPRSSRAGLQPSIGDTQSASSLGEYSGVGLVGALRVVHPPFACRGQCGHAQPSQPPTADRGSGRRPVRPR